MTRPESRKEPSQLHRAVIPRKKFYGPIARISGRVDAKTRTMPVELDVKDPKAELDPGTFCEVAWPVRRAYPTLFVPATAVGNDLERTFVIRVRNNRAEWVDVKTGVTSGNLIEVFGDLAEGDEVAIRGTDQIRSGTAATAKEGGSSRSPGLGDAVMPISYARIHAFHSIDGASVSVRRHRNAKLSCALARQENLFLTP